MTTEIDQARLAEVATLLVGTHAASSKQYCVLEAVSYITHESDTRSTGFLAHPLSVCPVIATFVRSWSDTLPQDERDRYFLPLLTRFVDTKATAAVEARRATIATDWLVRTHLPAWLRVGNLTARANAIAAYAEVTDFAIATDLRALVQTTMLEATAAQVAAENASGPDADISAQAVVQPAIDQTGLDAAEATARATAALATLALTWGGIEGFARDAAKAAAIAGVTNAAQAAAAAGTYVNSAANALTAARNKVAQTRTDLQQSALALIDRLITATA